MTQGNRVVGEILFHLAKYVNFSKYVSWVETTTANRSIDHPTHDR